jgi:hypothetical protein
MIKVINLYTGEIEIVNLKELISTSNKDVYINENGDLVKVLK